jgi:DNA-binding SARP family transcriptional activator
MSIVQTEFCLLGPVTVRHGGIAVPVAHGKQRSVLASPLLSAGRMVSLGEFAEALWGPGPPPSADVSIRNYVRLWVPKTYVTWADALQSAVLCPVPGE